MKALSQYIENMITDQDIKMKYVFKINNVDYSSYLLNWKVSANKEFGANEAAFVLNNDGGVFGEGGVNKINIGDIISFFEYYGTDVTEFPRFYGIVTQRSILKSANDRNITLICLDYIATLEYMDIDLEVEGDKVLVENETLTPNYLASPNESLAQVFNFANDNIADDPLPIIMIKNKDTDAEDPQYDGYEILYENGQLKLGFPLNALYNYDLIVVSYYFYVKGKYAEDIIQEILSEVDAYDNYMFGETSENNFINNHLRETFFNTTGITIDYMTPNYTSSTITIETTLTANVTVGTTSISVVSTSGFPTVGEGEVNGDIFTWTGKTSTTLTGIPSSGSYALKAHDSSSYVKYESTYAPGSVWYLRFSNVIDDLNYSNFVIPGGTFNYFDKRYGRIILTDAISTSAIVKCYADYTFCTLQATGIEINRMSFNSREIQNRLEAINKVREYLAPNFVIRTVGNNKIWASYLSQKVTADYTLELATQINYLEDQDLYTRVTMYTKNKNPTNLMFGGDVSFVGTGESYKATASASELSLIREEGSYYVYGSPVSGVGKITTDIIKPIIYINDIPIDNTSHLIAGQEISTEIVTKTVTEVSGGGK